MKVKTFQRISAQKSKELERVSQETQHLRGVLDEKQKRITELDRELASQLQSLLLEQQERAAQRA